MKIIQMGILAILLINFLIKKMFMFHFVKLDNSRGEKLTLKKKFPMNIESLPQKLIVSSKGISK